MSGYTTTINQEKAYRQDKHSATSDFSSWNIINMILDDKNQSSIQESYSKNELRDILMTISTEDFFKHYSDRKSYQELPLLQSDGIVIPEEGLRKALSNPKYMKDVPIIAGSTRDEVKLWLASARYFVDVDYLVLFLECLKLFLKMRMHLTPLIIIEVLHGKLEEWTILFNQLQKLEILIFMLTDMIGTIIESILLLTLRNLLVQHMQLKFLFWLVIISLLEAFHSQI
jgi:hypothetical protein